MKEALLIIVIMATVGGIIGATVVGVTRNDQASCFKWQKEAQRYPGYYITAWQKQQCDYYSIDVGAEVR